jgi:hypothetical protein
MKKTLIAVAALAATGAFAQVSLTGGLDFTYSKGAQSVTDGSSAKGLVGTDAYVTFAAADDMGGGVKSMVQFAWNSDGSRASSYGDDKSFQLTNGTATLAIATTRTGGTLGATLLAPSVHWDDQWSTSNALVMSRGEIDVASVSYRITPAFTAAYKYLEAGSGPATPPYAAHVITGKFAFGALTSTVDYASYNYSDGAKAGSAQVTAIAQTTGATAATTGTFGAAAVPAMSVNARTTKLTANAIYDAGVAKFAVGYETGAAGVNADLTTGTSASLVSFGVSAPLGVVTAGVSYAKRDASSYAAVGVMYPLSKRTFVGASIGMLTNPAGNQDSYGIRIGQTF